MSTGAALPANPLWSLLAEAARRAPEGEALVDGRGRATWSELHDRCARLGAGLRVRGVGPGERVAALLPNVRELFELYFACAAAGAVLCPLNLRLAAPELSFVLGDCEPRLFVADGGLEELARAAAAASRTPLVWARTGAGREDGYDALLAAGAEGWEPRALAPDALAQLYYTSGTTGRPKGVILTQRNVFRHALAAIAELGLGARDRWGHFAPMFHLADAWATFAVTGAGGTHVMLPRFAAQEALACIERERVTLTNLVPTMLTRMVHHPRAGGHDLASLRLVLSGGAPIAPELVRRVMATFGCEYAQTYGLTETSPYLTISLLDEELRALPPAEQLRYRAKTGRPFATVELSVTDEAGRPVPPDGRTVGEIRARGETVSPGYWRRPEETAAAFDGGWLLTGDLATVDARGFLEIVDRKKDVILSGGETVYSTEVEHALVEHRAVLECAVFGVPDAEWGEGVTAAVVLRPGALAVADELRAHCAARLGAYKLPRRVLFLDELPKTGSGKIQKSVLRRRFAQ